MAILSLSFTSCLLQPPQKINWCAWKKRKKNVVTCVYYFLNATIAFKIVLRYETWCNQITKFMIQTKRATHFYIYILRVIYEILRVNMSNCTACRNSVNVLKKKIFIYIMTPICAKLCRRAKLMTIKLIILCFAYIFTLLLWPFNQITIHFSSQAPHVCICVLCCMNRIESFISMSVDCSLNS